MNIILSIVIAMLILLSFAIIIEIALKPKENKNDEVINEVKEPPISEENQIIVSEPVISIVNDIKKNRKNYKIKIGWDGYQGLYEGDTRIFCKDLTRDKIFSFIIKIDSTFNSIQHRGTKDAYWQNYYIKYWWPTIYWKNFKNVKMKTENVDFLTKDERHFLYKEIVKCHVKLERIKKLKRIRENRIQREKLLKDYCEQ